MGTRTIAELRIAAPAARVWNALREPREIKRWFGWEHGGLDAEVEFIFGSDAEVVEEGRRLRFSGVDTTVTISGLGAGSSLRVTKPADGSDALPYDEVEAGWITFLQQLRFALERHPEEARRTVYLAATAARAPLDAFEPLGGCAIGSRYELTAAEKIAGELWFEHENQFGLTVDEAGDGLLIVARNPQAATASAILTTYGLDDDAFEWLRARWTEWWKAV